MTGEEHSPRLRRVTLHDDPHLVQSTQPSVTEERRRQLAADRKRRQRERDRAKATATAPLLYERQDWQLYVNSSTLPQKAGCDPSEIGKCVIKDITDNGLDEGFGIDIDYNRVTKNTLSLMMVSELTRNLSQFFLQSIGTWCLRS